MESAHRLFELAKAIAARIIGIETERDRKSVEEWIEEDGSHNFFLNELTGKEEYLKNENELRKFPSHQAWKEVRNKISFTKSYYIRKILPYAAAFLVLLTSATLLYLSYNNQKRGGVDSLADIPPGIKGAVLILEDGRSVDVNSGKIFEIRATDGTKIQKDSAGLDYKLDPESLPKRKSSDDKEVYNIIQTSKGMEYPLRLADGTKIYINSESRLKFPVSFRGNERIIELEGEAFFEVAKDPSRPFVVKSGDVEIRVLGTQFNLKSYRDEEFVVTTLVEGSLIVNTRKLNPGEQLLYSRDTGETEVKKVSTDIYTAWKNGKFVFRNERLQDIIKSLARWYDFEYSFLDDKAKDLCFGASFDRYDNMNPILKMLIRTDLVEIKQEGSTIYIYSKN